MYAQSDTRVHVYMFIKLKTNIVVAQLPQPIAKCLVKYPTEIIALYQYPGTMSSLIIHFSFVSYFYRVWVAFLDQIK